MLFHLLRDVDGPDHRRAQHLLLPTHQVLEEVDCDVVVRWQVDANVSGEEVIYLALATILRCELLRGDRGHLPSACTVLLHCMVAVVHLLLFLRIIKLILDLFNESVYEFVLTETELCLLLARSCAFISSPTECIMTDDDETLLESLRNSFSYAEHSINIHGSSWTKLATIPRTKTVMMDKTGNDSRASSCQTDSVSSVKRVADDQNDYGDNDAKHSIDLATKLKAMVKTHLQNGHFWHRFHFNPALQKQD